MLTYQVGCIPGFGAPRNYVAPLGRKPRKRRKSDWPASDDARLLSLRANGLFFHEIAEQMQRSKAAVAVRYYTLTNGIPGAHPADAQGKDYFRKVVAEVSASTSVSSEDILGQCRDFRYVRARQEVAWRLRQALDHHGKPRFSMPQIGAWMNRDHTTILHAVRAHQARTGRVSA